MGKIQPPPSITSVLKPILPNQFDRFGPQCSQNTPLQHDIPLKSIQIRARSCTAGSELPSEPLTQKKLIHPEGGSIYCHERLVSDQAISASLQSIGDEILSQCSESGLCDTTVFVRLQGSAFEYYVAAHSDESIVWIDNQRPDGVREVAESRLNNVLSEEYWAHMEAIPGARHVSSDSITRLKNVLSSLAIDSATSDGSTSPFSYDQIQDFLRFLNEFGGEHIDEHQTYAVGKYHSETDWRVSLVTKHSVVARIWNMIWHARVINNFGSSNACLDRFIPLSNSPPAFTGTNGLLALATLGAADRNLVRCSRAWAGRIAYVGEWRQFKTKNETEWKQVIQLACVTVIASLLLFDESSCKLFRTLSTLLSLSAAAYGHHLVVESQNLGDHAADASVYFQTWEKPEYNVQRIALRNAAPQALLGWAFISLVGAILPVL